jgi:hypothetical protein
MTGTVGAMPAGEELTAVARDTSGPVIERAIK